MTSPGFELMSHRQKVSKLPTEPPGRPLKIGQMRWKGIRLLFKLCGIEKVLQYQLQGDLDVKVPPPPNLYSNRGTFVINYVSLLIHGRAVNYVFWIEPTVPTSVAHKSSIVLDPHARNVCQFTCVS